jgi:hypothetical protein
MLVRVADRTAGWRMGTANSPGPLYHKYVSLTNPIIWIVLLGVFLCIDVNRSLRVLAMIIGFGVWAALTQWDVVHVDSIHWGNRAAEWSWAAVAVALFPRATEADRRRLENKVRYFGRGP